MEGSEQPNLVEEVPVHGRRVGLDDPLQVPSNPKHLQRLLTKHSYTLQSLAKPCNVSPSHELGRRELLDPRTPLHLAELSAGF